jgi:tetratricopeptide (TPR) repeat protein
LLTGFGVALWQADRAQELANEAQVARARAESEYARSEATKDFLVRSLDLAGLHSMGRKLSVDDLMLTMAERIDTEMQAHPSSQGELRVVVGQSLAELGQVQRGLALAERGREQLAQLNPQATPLMAVVLNKVGVLRRKAGDLVGAEAAMRASMAMLDQLPGDHRLQRIQNRTVLDHILALRGRWGESLINTQARLAERSEILGADDPGLAVDYNNLAVALGRMDRYAEALTAYERCLQLLELGGNADSARTGSVERGRAQVLARLERFDEAQQALDHARELRERNLPADHPDHLDTRFAQVGILRARGDIDAASAALTTLIKSAGPQERRLGELHYERARLNMSRGRWHAVARDFDDAAGRLQEIAGGNNCLSIYARAAASYARFRLDGDSASAETALATQYGALEELGLQHLDEGAEISLMRAQVALAEKREGDAARLTALGLADYAKLQLKAPAWVGTCGSGLARDLCL